MAEFAPNPWGGAAVNLGEAIFGNPRVMAQAAHLGAQNQLLGAQQQLAQASQRKAIAQALGIENKNTALSGGNPSDFMRYLATGANDYANGNNKMLGGQLVLDQNSTLDQIKAGAIAMGQASAVNKNSAFNNQALGDVFASEADLQGLKNTGALDVQGMRNQAILDAANVKADNDFLISQNRDKNRLELQKNAPPKPIASHAHSLKPNDIAGYGKLLGNFNDKGFPWQNDVKTWIVTRASQLDQASPQPNPAVSLTQAVQEAKKMTEHQSPWFSKNSTAFKSGADTSLGSALNVGSATSLSRTNSVPVVPAGNVGQRIPNPDPSRYMSGQRVRQNGVEYIIE